MDGIEVLERIKTIDEGVEVILVTAVKTVRTAVAAMKLGIRLPDEAVRRGECCRSRARARAAGVEATVRVPPLRSSSGARDRERSSAGTR